LVLVLVLVLESKARSLCKPETKWRVCITVENSANPSSVYIKLWKHRKKLFYCIYKISSSKNRNAGKDQKKSFYWSKRIFLQHWFDDGFLNWPIKTWWWRVYNSCIFTSHNYVYILSCKHASRPIRARVLS